MTLEAFALAAMLWLAGLVLTLLPGGGRLWPPRVALALGCLAGLVGAVLALPGGSGTAPWYPLGATHVAFRLDPAALWLLAWGLLPAGLAVLLGSPVAAVSSRRRWLFGAGTALLGMLGVMGMRDGVSFLIAWELMSLGGAVMILGEERRAGLPVLFMLGLLEVGAVALLLAFLLLGHGDMGFAAFPAAWAGLSKPAAFLVGLLLLIGTGAKLGLLPFYEWFPAAYGAGSGVSGALLSGVVLNAAFFALGRALLHWLPAADWTFALGLVVLAAGVISAVLAILYAFQQGDWRMLLSFSSAENAGLAVTALGAALLFRAEGLTALMTLAWMVSLIHLAGHSLAKGAMFLAADGTYTATGTYRIVQGGVFRRAPWTLGLGALCAAMSLAAMPPQAGFVSEWYLFQTLFQDFHLTSTGGRIALALAGAGVALTASVALATFVKALGVGLMGPGATEPRAPGAGHRWAVLTTGLAVLLLAVGMPWWLDGLVQAAWSGVSPAVLRLRDGWLLVPLTAHFAFISPTKLVMVMPLLAIIPVALILYGRRRGYRRAKVWAGGLTTVPPKSATTALAFSNALRTFYSFVYRPTQQTDRDYAGQAYFVKRLRFDYAQAPVFGPLLFAPATRLVERLAARLAWLQMGLMNLYLALIGVLLLLILTLTLL